MSVLGRTGLEAKLRRALEDLGVGRSVSAVVAVSGGADSTALLDALCRGREEGWGPEALSVAHLNHQLRGEESDADEEFVRALAAQYNLPCDTERAPIEEAAKKTRKNLEATAREWRYDFLRRVAEEREAAYVCTAHTLDDQAETILMRLLRGSGAAGLIGIHRRRPLSESSEGVVLIRPLLDVSRQEVLAYCQRHSLAFRLDRSNYLIDYTRNRIRQELLPMLRTYNPGLGEILGRMADLLRDEDAYLEESARAGLVSARRGEGLEIPAWLSLHPAIGRRALRQWLRERRGDLRRLTSVHLAAVERLLRESQSDRMVELPGGGRVIREFDRLRFEEGKATVSTPSKPVPLVAGEPREFGRFRLELRRHCHPEIPPPDLPASDWIVRLREGSDLDGLIVRARQPGDSYLPATGRHTIKLKTLLIRHKIPRAERDTYPLVTTADNRIVWVPGAAPAREFSWDPEVDRASPCAYLLAAEKEKMASEN